MRAPSVRTVARRSPSPTSTNTSRVSTRNSRKPATSAMRRSHTPASGTASSVMLNSYLILQYSSVHKRKVHNIGKPIDEVTPRGPNLKLRKRYQQMQDQEAEFDKLTSTPARRNKRMKLDDDDTDEEEMEDLDLNDDEEPEVTKTIQVGDKNFTFSFS